MFLSPAQQTRLATLQAARDSLAMGQAVAEVEYAGGRTVYSKADINLLDRLIAELTSGYGTVRRRL